MPGVEACGLISGEDATLLIRADHVWRSVLGLLAISVGRTPTLGLPQPVVDTLARATGIRHSGEADEASLAAALDRLAHQVRNAFVRLIGDPENDDRATR